LVTSHLDASSNKLLKNYQLGWLLNIWVRIWLKLFYIWSTVSKIYFSSFLFKCSFFRLFTNDLLISFLYTFIYISGVFSSLAFRSAYCIIFYSCKSFICWFCSNRICFISVSMFLAYLCSKLYDEVSSLNSIVNLLSFSFENFSYSSESCNFFLVSPNLIFKWSISVSKDSSLTFDFKNDYLTSLSSCSMWRRFF